jgi:hypothetical protein
MKLQAAPLLLLALLPGLTACSDYNVNTAEKPSPEGEEPEPEPEPEGPQPELQVEPNPIDWGNVLVDCPREKVITLSNVGEADLDITEIRPAGEDEASFLIPDGASWTLAPGDSTTVTLQFQPGDIREHSGELEVTSNDPAGPVTAVPMEGEGVASGLMEEAWEAEPYAELDVLWVVDNSCSMADAVDLVRTNFGTYIDQFLDLGVDYHMAAITTDMDAPDQQGRIQGEIITSAMDPTEAASAFLSAVDVGSGGSSEEKGVGATQAALSEPLLSGDNSGFLRPNAALAVVVITDENDASGVSADNFVRFLEGLKDDPSKVRVSGFMGLEFDLDIFGCSVDSASEIWVRSAALTEGFAEDICTEDWSTAMRSMSLASAGIMTTFTLAAVPDGLSSINVEIDGVRVRYDPANGWTWDDSTNTVSLHGASIPAPGQRVVITYTSSSCAD